MPRKVYQVTFTMTAVFETDVEAASEQDAIAAAEAYCEEDLIYDYETEATEALEGIVPEIVAEDYLDDEVDE